MKDGRTGVRTTSCRSVDLGSVLTAFPRSRQGWRGLAGKGSGEVRSVHGFGVTSARRGAGNATGRYAWQNPDFCLR